MSFGSETEESEALAVAFVCVILTGAARGVSSASSGTCTSKARRARQARTRWRLPHWGALRAPVHVAAHPGVTVGPDAIVVPEEPGLAETSSDDSAP
jgi:hypothetical protein